jgi:chitinase
MMLRRFPLTVAATVVAVLGAAAGQLSLPAAQTMPPANPASAAAGGQTTAAGQAKPAIIAYVFPRNELIVPSEIAADKLTHINYAFADVKDGRMVEGFVRDTENLKLLAELRRQHPHLQILISVGGWTWSGNFSDAALTVESRRRFTDSAMEFVRRHDIDGVDIDWEYPGLRGNDNVHRPEDRENFTAMMTELRHALDAEGRARNRRYLLTFAAGAFPDFIAKTEMGKVQALVDFVNLMTYDFRTSDPIAGHHANLSLHPADAKKRSVDSAVRDFLAAGVPAAKVVVGVPFYGRAWADIKGEGTGPYQPGSRPTERIEANYGPMSTTLIDRGGFVRMWDSQAQAPYLWNKDTRTFISYEDPESLRLKSAYIREKGLGGAMFWEYYADKTGVLLDTLFTTLRGSNPTFSKSPRSAARREADRTSDSAGGSRPPLSLD